VLVAEELLLLVAWLFSRFGFGKRQELRAVLEDGGEADLLGLKVLEELLVETHRALGGRGPHGMV